MTEDELKARFPTMSAHRIAAVVDAVNYRRAAEERAQGEHVLPLQGARGVVLTRDIQPPCPQCGGRRQFRGRWRVGTKEHVILLCERGCTADGGKMKT